MKKFLILILVLFTVASCAEVTPAIEGCIADDDPYSFFGGLWHGIISPFSFIGSLFMDEIAVYAVNNTGGWYDFGFILGIGGFASGASR